MKYLKYKHQSIFPLWGRVKLNFRDRYKKPNIFSKNPSHCQIFFTGLSKNDFDIILQGGVGWFLFGSGGGPALRKQTFPTK